MDKSLYSLILMDEVVAAIDRIALRENMSRSALVNRILAEYASLVTPEQRVDRVFRALEEMLSDDRELIPFASPRQMTMAVKSSLAYKYRPTIRYEVQLFRVPDGALGELSVLFRTQSQELLTAMTAFFRFWMRLEQTCVAHRYPSAIRYELEDGRFTRSLAAPIGCDYDSEEFGRAISDYVRMFDTLLKKFIGGTPFDELERQYRVYCEQGIGLI